MRDRDQLLERARKCFEDAAASDDPAQMKLHAEMGRHYLELAAIMESETKSAGGNGEHGA
jgi:hypothetical protein